MEQDRSSAHEKTSGNPHRGSSLAVLIWSGAGDPFELKPEIAWRLIAAGPPDLGGIPLGKTFEHHSCPPDPQALQVLNDGEAGLFFKYCA